MITADRLCELLGLHLTQWQCELLDNLGITEPENGRGDND